MRTLDLVRETSEYLEKSGIEDALVDAEMIVFNGAGVGRLEAYTDNPEVDRNSLLRIRRHARRRALREPIQYIIGHVDFLNLRIEVGKGVLIPRPETELLAQEAIRVVQDSSLKIPARRRTEDRKQKTGHGHYRVLDLCTGSGCIALALAKEFRDASVYGTDVSRTAMRYAKKNAELNGIRNVEFFSGSLFRPVKDRGPFDMIVSNPPYIRTGDIPGLQEEVKDWEPVQALDGGREGLDFYLLIFEGANDYLKAGGFMLLELGFDQAASVREIAKSRGFAHIMIKKDFAEIERILIAER